MTIPPRTETGGSLTGPLKFDRILPENPEAEIALLEACFAGPEGLEKARAIIKCEDFSRIAGRDIFRRLCDFDDAGRPFNITAIDQSFEGDPEYLAYSDTLFSLFPITTSVIPDYGKIILENSLRRKIIAATERVNQLAFNQTVSNQELLVELETACTEVRKRLEGKA